MTKRPGREAVASAITTSKGNLSKAAATLGCSRASLYTWIWQLGLQRIAQLDTRERQGAEPSLSVLPPVKSDQAREPRLHGVMNAEAVTTDDVRMPHNVRVRDSLWTRVAHVVVDRKISMSDAVEEALTKWADEQEGK